MGQHYLYLNKTERSLIKDWRQLGLPLREIGRRLQRSHSTISRELRRNLWCGKYGEFVAEGIRNGSIWGQLTNQIYLGDTDFVDKVQQNLAEKDRNINIPKVQKRPVPQSLVNYQTKYPTRNKMIIAAYSSGGFSYQEIGEYLGLHFTTVGRIIRESKN